MWCGLAVRGHGAARSATPKRSEESRRLHPGALSRRRQTGDTARSLCGGRPLGLGERGAADRKLDGHLGGVDATDPRAATGHAGEDHCDGHSGCDRGRPGGIVLMRQQHHTDELASQLVYAQAQAKAHELENQLVRADRLVTVGVMATEIAHEIGTPLGVVRGRAEQVLPNLGEGAGAEDLRVVIKQVDHISSTIRQLLDFSRRSPLEKRSISLETVVERTRELLQLKLEARHLQLDLDLNADLPLLTADPDQLQQVLVNLLLNACDASRAGDRLSVSARCAPKDMVLIEVSDPGCGIPAENLKAIFDPFFTTKPRGEGTGLGLPISVGIVRNHGGQIDVRSAPGGGTSVTVLWPASSPSGAPVA